MLHVLASQHGTDKLGHGYCRPYELLLSDYCGCHCVLLEMGVAQGASLRMWRDWLPLADIIGFDKADYEPTPDDHGFRVVKGDQSVVADLERLIETMPAVDIIIDDAGHNREEQRVAFRTLWPALNSGGWYVIEDITLRQPSEASVLFDVTAPEQIRDLTLAEAPYRELHLFGERCDDGILFLRKR